MTFVGRIIAVCGLLTLGACVGIGTSSDPINQTVSGWKLDDVSVRFGPDISRTADGNTYSSNFVFNAFNTEAGNRKKLVVALFKQSMQELGDVAMTGQRAVDMDVTVTYFHAITEYSRAWCCGAHKIYANIQVKDAQSGEVLATGENLALGRVALGGTVAWFAEAAGRDQWTRLKEGIISGTRDWLEEN